jgi:hypothetical protein
VVSVVALIITVVISAPVLRAPSERVFGMEIVGREHDPFTMMRQFGRPVSIGVYSQPVTDITGALIARSSGAVAAYNWLVLLSFPLSAAAAYLLARYLALSPAGATVAALAYAFSPFHVAHAAYHPHIAQTQWVPLYLLALWRCLDNGTPLAVGFLAAATMAVTLSNFYGGLIAAVITPVAIAAHWLAKSRVDARSARRLAITIGSLVLIGGAGVAYGWSVARAVVLDSAAFAFPRADLFRYSARWWGYLVPPVANPFLGVAARRVWSDAGVHEGLLEQQVSLGWGIVILGSIAVFSWLARDRQPASLVRVPSLALVAVAALVCSLSPERTIGAFTFVRPSALLYELLPMFRAYARFGVVVQLMAALLAGIGVDRLRRSGRWHARIVGVALLLVAACEYAVWPSALWRDVLPTTAHRWIARQPDRMRALDCVPLSRESASVEWLMGGRVSVLSGQFDDCADPNLAGKLAAAGYTHLLVRRETWESRWFAQRTLDGLRVAARFDDADVFAVTAAPAPLYTAEMTAFFPVEHDESRTWRWLGHDASWRIVNRSGRPVVAAVDIEMWALGRARRLGLQLDGREVQVLLIQEQPRPYRVGPLVLVPGDHELAFHPAEPPTVADDLVKNGDRRSLSFAVGAWRWTVLEEQP